MAIRNPKWDRNELILALDLYFQLDPGRIHARNSKIISLSETLNQLPIHQGREKYERFRNPNGVGLKLSNFLALDDNYEGKGMSSTSKLDKQIFEEFKNEKELLRSLAEAIRNSVTDQYIRQAVLSVADAQIDADFARVEGSILYKYHLYRERNPGLAKKKKQQAMDQFGKLACELCGFDFAEKYGKVGQGFIECHHIKPLHLIVEEAKTTLNDLMLVCANCHRMLHRGMGQ